LTSRLTIALDAMGGDRAPQMVISGANIARRRFPQVHYLIYGDEARVRPIVERVEGLKEVCEIRHTSVAVGNEDKPSVALRAGRQSSMRLAIDAVDAGEAAGVVSAGNTGALMAMAKIVLRTVPGIDRPAIGSFYPTLRGESVMLDLGANVVCDAQNLVQFAVMGEVFARTVLGISKPSVGLLNVGAEEQKGHEEVRAAAALLRTTDLPIRFHGFVEGDDITAGTVDVVVTDGFSGNIALKTAEGTVKLYSEFLRGAFGSSLMARIGYLFARNALNKVRKRIDPRRYNGAMLLGLNGIVVKSHGGTDALGFANAVGVAVDMASNDFNTNIRDEIAHVHAAASNPRVATGE
jgi:glycerol-3-phosphate acyltransferase PlsX